MTWLEHHSISEQCASQAEEAVRRGITKTAQELYLRAADEEMLALLDLDKSKTRTVGITAVSVASLFFKAKAFSQAERCAREWLDWDALPAFAADQLRDIIKSVSSAREMERHPKIPQAANVFHASAK